MTKHTWDTGYIRRLCGGARKAREWEQEKAQELAEYWGSPVTCYHTRGKSIFRPYIDWTTIEPLNDPILARKIWEFLPSQHSLECISFLELHEKADMPFCTLYRVIKAMDAMIHLKICRNGRLCFVRRKGE